MSGSGAIVTLGKVIGVFGVQGWIKVYSYTAKPESILDYAPWYLYQKNTWLQVKLLGGKRHGKGLIANIEGVADRDAAFELNGSKIGVLRTSLPSLSNDEYYWSDLKGLSVTTINGVHLGKIAYLFETGANDVMVVQGERERWLPWIMADVVKSVDLVAGTVSVDWDPDF